MRKVLILLLVLGWATTSFSLDLSKSNRHGHYPWEGTPVYEQIALVSLPAQEFNAQMMASLARTPFAAQMIVPLEFRPLTVAVLVGEVIRANFGDEWEVISGDPNPIIEPIFEALYTLLLEDQKKAQEVARRLSATPLMMPDSGGSAVLELKNRLYDPRFLDQGLKYALALPWKVGFWVEGDLVHVDMVNPEAVVKLFFRDLPPEEREDLEKMASGIRDSLKRIVLASLYALFPEEAVSFAPEKLPPYLPEELEEMDFGMEVGEAEGVEDVAQFLLNPGPPFNDSLLEMENPAFTMAISFPSAPEEVFLVHPFFFQTYAAFDGMASFLTSAYENPSDQRGWVASPDGFVLDDFVFLAAKTYPESPLYDREELTFYRGLLTPLFKATFLRPRGNRLISFEDSAGNKAYLVVVGSPYYGQILLRLGAHRAPGTPCKLVAFREGNTVKVLAYDTAFMFRHFFGDTDPRQVTDWDGAFSWPEGKGLSELAYEARDLYLSFLRGALESLGATGRYQISLKVRD